MAANMQHMMMPPGQQQGQQSQQQQQPLHRTPLGQRVMQSILVQPGLQLTGWQANYPPQERMAKANSL